VKWVWHEAVWLKDSSPLGLYMQPAVEHSPWPKRIMIAGLVLGFIGVISFSFISGDLMEYYDPREVSEHSAQYGDVNTITLSPGCWVVNVEGDDADYEVTFQYVEGGGAGDTVSDDCRSDFQTMGTDVEFSTVSKLDIEKESEILVTIECKSEDGCENPLLFTNSEDVVLDMFSDVGLWIAGTTCCTGAILLPLGWILVSINKGKENKVYVTQQQMIGAMTPDEQNFNPDQEILTTDQLYKLVRGELPEESGQANVPSPFSDADTRVKTPTKTKTGGSINRASSYTHENPPTDESWKNWDEA